VKSGCQVYRTLLHPDPDVCIADHLSSLVPENCARFMLQTQWSELSRAVGGLFATSLQTGP
jgi:hypothetical protein